VLLGAGIGGGAVGIALRRRFDLAIREQIDSMLAAVANEPSTQIIESDLASLPEPVQRWLRWSGVVGLAIPSSIRLKQVGQFRLAANRPWMPFAAEQYYTTDPPGFVWKVRMQFLPLLSMVGADRYIGGLGSIDMRLNGLFPVAAQAGGALNEAALLRYLDEIVWFPQAALSRFITWQPHGTDSAIAAISDAGLTARATFVFDEDGRPTKVVATRYNSNTRRAESWLTICRDHVRLNGVGVPAGGEGIWRLSSGELSYIRLDVTRLDYKVPVRF
jgi:hypothetical protein